MSKTIVFFGTDTFSASALEALIAAGYDVAAVVTKPDSKQGRGQKLTPPLVKRIAAQHDIPVLQPQRLTDIIDELRALAPAAGVLSSFGRIIPDEILSLFEPGIINVHPSLLPKYRGPSPIEAAILNGDETTGVSIMKLVAAMDAGPVYAQETYALKGDETQPMLYETLASLGSRLLLETLPGILEGTIKPVIQDESAASYTPLLKKEDALLDVSSMTADQAARKIRAHLVYPKTKLDLHGHSVVITAAHASDARTSLLDQTCQDGRFLVIDRLIGPSGREMSGHDFLNGYAAGA